MEIHGRDAWNIKCIQRWQDHGLSFSADWLTNCSCFLLKQDPHQHRLSVDVIPELRNAENYCRNPGAESDRPWCYTANPNVRWEYCLVPKCGEGTIDFPFVLKIQFIQFRIRKSLFIALLKYRWSIWQLCVLRILMLIWISCH